MTKVKCSVQSCSYNQNGDCFVSEVNIGGKGATNEMLTCCGSFLNKNVYSNLAQYTSMRGEAEEVLCRVDTCRYYETGKCSLLEIQVGERNEAKYYTETDCLSFEKA